MFWMLKYFVNIVLLFPIFLNAQITISNLSLTDTTQNIFYIGIDNTIKISGKQYDPANQKHVIMGGGGTLQKKEKGVYIVRVQEETDDCKIWITLNNRPVSKHHFRVRKIGDYVVRYSGLKDSIATINQLLINPFIYVDIPGSYYKHNINITSFSATFIIHSVDSLETLSTSNRLTAEQIETIKKLIPGNKIYFNNIYAVSPDGRRRRLTSFTITIK